MLEIKNLTVTTNKDQEIKTLVKDVTFAVQEKDMILLSGNNGSGKTSLLFGIFKHPDYIREGEIFLGKKDVSDLEVYELAKNGLYLAMQMVPEIEGVKLVQFLYKSFKSIYPNETLSILDFNKKLEKYCEEFAIDKTFLSRELNVGLSGGEKKKAELLHLLALKPKCVFLDEPDSGVDQESIQIIAKVIKYLNENHNTSFVIVSHGEKLKTLLNITKELKMEAGKLL